MQMLTGQLGAAAGGMQMACAGRPEIGIIIIIGRRCVLP